MFVRIGESVMGKDNADNQADTDGSRHAESDTESQVGVIVGE
jgi:hypothetical protein